MDGRGDIEKVAAVKALNSHEYHKMYKYTFNKFFNISALSLPPAEALFVVADKLMQYLQVEIRQPTPVTNFVLQRKLYKLFFDISDEIIARNLKLHEYGLFLKTKNQDFFVQTFSRYFLLSNDLVRRSILILLKNFLFSAVSTNEMHQLVLVGLDKYPKLKVKFLCLLEASDEEDFVLVPSASSSDTGEKGSVFRALRRSHIKSSIASSQHESQFSTLAQTAAIQVLKTFVVEHQLLFSNAVEPLLKGLHVATADFLRVIARGTDNIKVIEEAALNYRNFLCAPANEAYRNDPRFILRCHFATAIVEACSRNDVGLLVQKIKGLDASLKSQYSTPVVLPRISQNR